MSAFSDQLKSQADIGSLIGEHVALHATVKGWTGLCPFHQEKTPSFHVHREKRFFYCFGCHAHGDVFAFYMQLQKLSFSDAVAVVAERMHVPLPQFSSSESDPIRTDLLRIHAAAAGFYVRCLQGREGTLARSYLQGRDVSPSAQERFRVGYAPDGGRALSLQLENQGFLPSLALRAGLCQPRRQSVSPDGPDGPHANARQEATPNTEWHDFYDRFRGRIVFPIHDERGRPIAFGARQIDASADPRSPKYLNSPESLIYSKSRVLFNIDGAREAIRQLGYFILVEGYLDCLQVAMAGFGNVVASCGTALTSTQVGLVGRYAPRGLINFDPDTAGSAAAERSIGLMLEAGVQVHVVSLPQGLDPDLFIRRQGRDAYAAALKSSRPYFDYLGERARRQFDLRRAEGKLGAINFLLPYLVRVEDPIVRQKLTENVAAQLGIDHPMLTEQLKAAARTRRAALSPSATEPPVFVHAEIVLLRSWLEWEEWREYLSRLIVQERLLSGLGSEALFERLRVLVDGGSGASGTGRRPQDIPSLAAGLEPPDRNLLAEILLGRGVEEALDRASVEAAISALRDRKRQAHLRELNRDIDTASREPDKSRHHELLRRRFELDRERHRESASNGSQGSG